MLTGIISRHDCDVQYLLAIVRKLLGVKISQLMSFVKGLARNAVLVVFKERNTVKSPATHQDRIRYFRMPT
jgi:hypothetical protein